MNFSPEDILKFKICCQKITYSPTPVEDQAPLRQGEFLWCRDWETIEILKYLFNGREGYFGDPPPNRLKNNPLWSKEDIAYKAELLIAEYKTADRIIAFLGERRGQHAAA